MEEKKILISKKKIANMRRSFIILFTAIVVLTSFPLTVNAADSKNGRLLAWENQVKIGKYYYLDNSSGLYISSQKGKDGKLVLPNKKNGKVFNSDVYFSENYIYYSYSKNLKSYVYRMKVNGKSKKLIAKIASKKEDAFGKVEFIYKNQVYYVHTDVEGSDVYVINMKTKKVKYLKGCSFSIATKQNNEGKTLLSCYHYKNYYAANVGGYEGELCPTEKWIFDVKKQKLKLISKKAWAIGIGGKYVYYLENVDNNSSRLMRCNVNGKNKKKLKTIKRNNLYLYGITLYKVTSKYCIYSYWENGKSVNYQYTFSTKKTKKVQVE